MIVDEHDKRSLTLTIDDLLTLRSLVNDRINFWKRSNTSPDRIKLHADRYEVLYQKLTRAEFRPQTKKQLAKKCLALAKKLSKRLEAYDKPVKGGKK